MGIQKVEVVLVGHGDMGSLYGRHVIKCHDLRLHAVVGRNIDRVKQFIDSFLFEEQEDNDNLVSPIHNVNIEGIRNSIKASVDLEDVLKPKRTDKFQPMQGRKVVVIASPDHTHYEYCKIALKYGAFVMCEKPLAMEERHVEELFTLAIANKTYLHVGFQRRIDRNFLAFQKELSKRMVDRASNGVEPPAAKRRKSADCTFQEKLGTLESLRLIARDPSDGTRTRSYREVVFNSMIHDIDMAVWLLTTDADGSGEPPEFVYASAPDSSSVMAILKVPSSGKMAFIEYCDGIQYGYDQRLTAFGSKGVVYVDNPPVHTMSLTTSNAIASPPIHKSYLTRYRDAYKKQISLVVDVALSIIDDTEELQRWTKIMMDNKRMLLSAIAIGKRISLALEAQTDIEHLPANKTRMALPKAPTITGLTSLPSADSSKGTICQTLPIKIVLIGGGRMGQIRARSMRELPFLKIKYIVDMNKEFAEKVAEEFNAIGTNDVEKALSDPEVKAVWISTSTSTHFDLIKKATEYKKPIYCEKPISDDRNVTVQCYQVCAKAHTPLLCGWNRRYDPSISALVKCMEPLPAPNLIFCQNGDNPLPPTHLLKSLGSMFHDLLVHDIDTITNIMRQKFPARIFATGTSHVAELKGTGVIDSAILVLTYTDPNAVVYFHGRRRSNFGYDQQIEIVCLDGSLLKTTNISDNAFKAVRHSGSTRSAKINYTFEDRFYLAHKAEVEAFTKLLTDVDEQKKYDFGKELEQNWKVACICDFALESFKLQKEIIFE
eukprot:Nk52_evm37s1360 gene=Nk52_evmTU37s1360